MNSPSLHDASVSTTRCAWPHAPRACRRPATGSSRRSRATAGPGGVLIKTLALSLDPAMRGWMNEGKSYIPPVGIGEVMRAGGVGVVVASGTRISPSASMSAAAPACRNTGPWPPTRCAAAA
jgi:hypothetical protein